MFLTVCIVSYFIYFKQYNIFGNNKKNRCQEYQGGAVQDPGRDLRRPDVHLLLAGAGGLATQTGKLNTS